MKHKKLGLLAAVMALMVSLSACGGNKNNTSTNSTVSPSPSAETTIIPSETPEAGSVTENDINTGDVTDPNNSVAPGDGYTDSAHEDSSNEMGGSTFDSTNENGSAHENGKARTAPEGGVTPEDGNNHSANENGSHQEGSTVGEDMKRAGEDLGDAARDAAHSVEDDINNMGR